MMILVVGPCRSGTGDDSEPMARDPARLEETARPVFRSGHVPMIGEWVAARNSRKGIMNAQLADRLAPARVGAAASLRGLLLNVRSPVHGLVPEAADGTPWPEARKARRPLPRIGAIATVPVHLPLFGKGLSAGRAS
ncbi:hypothetical protein [Streptosporangium sp. NPDC000509]|uniref:hypothetical protein n=1 Tax=Streptosporangium sp. NPDC000509 TaxID=3366186 RepID=UPI0036A40336